MLLPTIFVLLSTFAIKAISVVMMAPQITNPLDELEMVHYSTNVSDAELENITILDMPYKLSSPVVTSVRRHRLYGKKDRSFSGKWKSEWKYESENVTVFAYQSGRFEMEDRFVIDENINNTGVSLYAVFDGYDGNFTVDYLAYNLMDSLRNKIINIKEKTNDENLKQYIDTEGNTNYSKLLRDEILAIDKQLLKELENHYPPYCGSTALISIIDGNRLFVANVGDSRAVMCNTEGNATRLTKDHSPGVPEERKRIEEAGGEVVDYPELDRYKIGNLVAMSRCLGNKMVKDLKYVIPDPDVFVYDLSECRSKFIILTTDGLWLDKRRGDQEVIDVINQNLDRDLLESTKKLAISITESVRFLDDNQTIMIIKTPR